MQVEISPSYFGVKPEDLNVHAAAARTDNRPIPSRPVGHVRGHTGMHQKVRGPKRADITEPLRWPKRLTAIADANRRYMALRAMFLGSVPGRYWGAGRF